ncbi:hypothetical protein ABPG77_008686 [Micractinium sp. CCAP 211/92]
MEGRPKRRLVVTVRAAADLSEPAGSAYVALTLGSETVETDVARIGKGTVNPVWDEPLELRLPPPLPGEQPLLLRVRVMNRITLFPDRLIGSGTQPLTDLFYGGGQHEVKVPLSVEGKPSGWLHLGVFLEREAGPGEAVGSAAGTVLGQVAGGGPASDTAASVPGPVLPSATKGEMLAREELGAGNVMDPSKPGFGVML